VFGAVVVLRLRRHRYTRRHRLLTLMVVAVLADKYMRGMPTSGHDLIIEIVCAAVGALFGFAMLAATSVTRDPRTGEILIWPPWPPSRYGPSCSARASSSPIQPPTGTGPPWHGSSLPSAHRHGSHSRLRPMTIASLVIVTVGTARRARSADGSDAGPCDGAWRVPRLAAAGAGTLVGGQPRTSTRRSCSGPAAGEALTPAPGPGDARGRRADRSRHTGQRGRPEARTAPAHNWTIGALIAATTTLPARRVIGVLLHAL